MDNQPKPSLISGKDDISYSFPNESVRMNTDVQSDIYDLQSTDNCNDQVDLGTKIKFHVVTSTGYNENSSVNQKIDIVNNIEADKSKIFEGNKSSCSYSEDNLRPNQQRILCPRVNCPEKIVRFLSVYNNITLTKKNLK